MPLINNMMGTSESKFQGYAKERNYFEVKLTGGNNFIPDLGINRNFIASTVILSPWAIYGRSSLTNTGIFIPSDSSGFSGTPRSGFVGQSLGSNNDFDLRWKFDEMNVPNGLGDGTCALQVGIFTSARIAAEAGGGFWLQVDSPISLVGKRRIQIKYSRDAVNADVVVFQKSESVLGDFGINSTVVGNQINGGVIQNMRIARFGNKLLAEWNTWSDNTAFSNGTDDYTSYCKSYRNSVEFFPLSGFNLNGKNPPSVFDDTVFPCSFARFSQSLLTTANAFCFHRMRLARFDSIPAICIDTTCDNKGTNVLSYSTDLIKFTTKNTNEGFSDLRISQLKISSIQKIQAPGDVFRFVRKEINTGRTTQYMFDNKLNNPKTNDLKTGIYIDEVYKFPNNQGNIYPNIYTDKVSFRIDSTYSLNMNKTGIVDNLEKFDNTDFNPSNFVSNTNVKRPTKSYFGKAILPTYMFHDGTYYIGRDAKFSFLDNILLTASGGETPQVDQYKVFERDATSMYLIETISDGTYFIMYSRIFNQYTKTLSSRVRINSDITINASNPTHSFTGTGGYLFSYRYYKPHPSIMTFQNKHVCAVSVDVDISKVLPNPSGLAFRIFLESEDHGATWFYRAKDSKNYGKAGEEFYAGQTKTIKVPNNDKYFFNFYANAGVVNAYAHRVDNFSMRPMRNTSINLLKYSGLANATDQTAFYVCAAYDPIQENINLCIGTLGGNIEVLKGPRMKKGALKGFGLVYPNEQWKSAFVSKPFADGKLGNFFCSFDKDGDMIIVASKRDDDTSFAILRTSYAKDDLNVMGRFMQTAQSPVTRIGRSLSNAYTDNNGDIILSSVSQVSGSPLQVILNLAKYGMHNNRTFELDLDEGFLYPQLPTNFGATVAFDTTTNGALITAGAAGFSSTGSAINTILRPLGSAKRGLKSEWRGFCEPLAADTTFTGNNVNLLFRCYGDAITAGGDNQLHRFQIGWFTNKVFVRDDNDPNPVYTMDEQTLDTTKLRRYMAVIERTSDNSVAGILYTENLELSNYEKIIWDKKLKWVAPFVTINGFNDACFLNIVGTRSLHMNYWFMQRNNAPIQPQRREKLRYFSELTHFRDYTNLEEFNGIPCSLDTTVKLGDGIKASWSGSDGAIGDRFNFTMNSYSRPSFLVDKEPFKSWRSVDDRTSNVIVFDATDQGFSFIRGDVAVFNNSNFRRCFVEAHTSSLLNAATTATYSKEVFFDLDVGNVFEDATNYGTSSVIPCNNKSWRPEEHVNRFVQFESCRLDGTSFRHLAFKIIDNAPNSLTIYTGPQRFDTTQGYRYVIYDPNQSANLSDCTSLFNFWRIRIPQTQIDQPATPSDETAQGSVYGEPYRELGEFDLGKITELFIDVDENIEISIQDTAREIELDNLSTVNFEFNRKRRTKRITYSTVNKELVLKIQQMFVELKGSYKTLWIFDDQKNFSNSFMLARITNEPDIEEINDGIQNISVEFEEVA